MVLLALFAISPVLRAGIIANNTGASSGSSFNIGGSDYSGDYLAQQFYMSASGNFALDSVTLQLDFSSAGSAAVDIFDVSGNETSLGIVSSSSAGDGQLVTLGVLSRGVTLLAGQSYALVLEPSGDNSVAWDYTTDSSSGGEGGVGAAYYSTTGGAGSFGTIPPGSGIYFQMQVAVVPEVPMTGLLMGFGVFGIAASGTLLRKFRPAFNRRA